jgi:AcrR family transcriptional regulator
MTDGGPGRDGAPGHGAGLRERKKLATRQAIGAAAMRLAVERGLESVLVEDIAAAAGVSPRTFNNYFASKYEAIAALALDRSARVGQALRRRPAAEDLWAAIRGAVLDVYAAEAGPAALPPAAVAGIRLVVSSPGLRGEYLKALALMQYDLAGAMTDRLAAAPAGRPGPYCVRALAGAVVSALQAATEQWLFADPPAPLPALLDRALGEMAAGLRTVLPAAQPARVLPSAPGENDALSAAASG